MVRQAPHNVASERHRDKQSKETFSGNESTFLGRDITFSGIKTTFLGLNLKKSAFLVIWSSFGVPSVVSRSSLGGIGQGIREIKETAILIKRTFFVSEFFGCSLVRLWFVLGLLPEIDREGTIEKNLKNRAIL